MSETGEIFLGIIAFAVMVMAFVQVGAIYALDGMYITFLMFGTTSTFSQPASGWDKSTPLWQN